ncbi:hypothetical protein R3P38DRAFT_3230785 [Favolaschia claudopus]|uniref:JmjC domain-containing protein n=1 Tax=Favolaschia claudopus TaxID=2862362 RepID=A0AAV9ZM70_9AGAR
MPPTPPLDESGRNPVRESPSNPLLSHLLFPGQSGSPECAHTDALATTSGPSDCALTASENIQIPSPSLPNPPLLPMPPPCPETRRITHARGPWHHDGFFRGDFDPERLGLLLAQRVDPQDPALVPTFRAFFRGVKQFDAAAPSDSELASTHDGPRNAYVSLELARLPYTLPTGHRAPDMSKISHRVFRETTMLLLPLILADRLALLADPSNAAPRFHAPVKACVGDTASRIEHASLRHWYKQWTSYNTTLQNQVKKEKAAKPEPASKLQVEDLLTRQTRGALTGPQLNVEAAIYMLSLYLQGDPSFRPETVRKIILRESPLTGEALEKATRDFNPYLVAAPLFAALVYGSLSPLARTAMVKREAGSHIDFWALQPNISTRSGSCVLTAVDDAGLVLLLKAALRPDQVPPATVPGLLVDDPEIRSLLATEPTQEDLEVLYNHEDRMTVQTVSHPTLPATSSSTSTPFAPAQTPVFVYDYDDNPQFSQLISLPASWEPPTVNANPPQIKPDVDSPVVFRNDFRHSETSQSPLLKLEMEISTPHNVTPPAESVVPLAVNPPTPLPSSPSSPTPTLSGLLPTENFDSASSSWRPWHTPTPSPPLDPRWTDVEVPDHILDPLHVPDVEPRVLKTYGRRNPPPAPEHEQAAAPTPTPVTSRNAPDDQTLDTLLARRANITLPRPSFAVAEFETQQRLLEATQSLAGGQGSLHETEPLDTDEAEVLNVLTADADVDMPPPCDVDREKARPAPGDLEQDKPATRATPDPDREMPPPPDDDEYAVEQENAEPGKPFDPPTTDVDLDMPPPSDVDQEEAHAAPADLERDKRAPCATPPPDLDLPPASPVHDEQEDEQREGQEHRQGDGQQEQQEEAQEGEKAGEEEVTSTVAERLAARKQREREEAEALQQAAEQQERAQLDAELDELADTPAPNPHPNNKRKAPAYDGGDEDEQDDEDQAPKRRRRGTPLPEPFTINELAPRSKPWVSIVKNPTKEEREVDLLQASLKKSPHLVIDPTIHYEYADDAAHAVRVPCHVLGLDADGHVISTETKIYSHRAFANSVDMNREIQAMVDSLPAEPLYLQPQNRYSAIDPSKPPRGEGSSVICAFGESEFIALTAQQKQQLSRHRVILIVHDKDQVDTNGRAVHFDEAGFAQFTDTSRLAWIQDLGAHKGDEMELRVGRPIHLVDCVKSQAEARKQTNPPAHGQTLNLLSNTHGEKTLPTMLGWGDLATHELACTYLKAHEGRVACGAKPWAIRKTLEGDLGNITNLRSRHAFEGFNSWEAQADKYHDELMYLTPRTTIIMPAGTMHWVLTSDDAIMAGRHLIPASNLLATIQVTLHNIMIANYTTNADHEAVRPVFIRIFGFIAQTYLDPRSSAYLQPTPVTATADKSNDEESARQRQYAAYEHARATAPLPPDVLAHVPDLTTPDGMLDLLALRSFTVLCHALHASAYKLLNQGQKPNALPITAEAFADLDLAWDLAIELDHHIGSHYTPKPRPGQTDPATWQSLASVSIFAFLAHPSPTNLPVQDSLLHMAASMARYHKATAGDEKLGRPTNFSTETFIWQLNHAIQRFEIRQICRRYQKDSTAPRPTFNIDEIVPLGTDETRLPLAAAFMKMPTSSSAFSFVLEAPPNLIRAYQNSLQVFTLALGL